MGKLHMIVKERRRTRGGKHVEHILGIGRCSNCSKRMMVFGNGPNIEMFEFENAKQRGPELQDVSYTHISFYVDDLKRLSQK